MPSEFRKWETQLKTEFRRDSALFGKEWAEELEKARDIILQRKRSLSVATDLAKIVKVPSLNTPPIPAISGSFESKKELRMILDGSGRRLKSDTSFMLKGHSVKDLEPRPFAHSPLWCLVHDRWFSEC